LNSVFVFVLPFGFSSVAKCLECLGALTHGDRRATETRDLSRFNIDNKYGKQALENVIRSICNLERPWASFPKGVNDFVTEVRKALINVGLISRVANNQQILYIPEKGKQSPIEDLQMRRMNMFRS